MSKPLRVIVIGVNHAGTSFIRSFRAFNQSAEIIAYDRNDNISFLGCGIALWVSGTVKNSSQLFYATPQSLAEKKVTIKMKHEVTHIDTQAKVITVTNLATGESLRDKYDKLVYAAGSWPANLKFENIDAKGIHISKTYNHAQQIIANAELSSVKSVAIIGGGYIGIELAEAFVKLGKKVHLIEASAQPMSNYFDQEFTEEMTATLAKHHVKLHLNEKLQRFEKVNESVSAVVTDTERIAAEMVLICVGFLPNTSLLSDAEKLPTGHVKIDAHARALGVNDVYVLGDSAAIYHASLERHASVALATNAIKTGLAAAADLAGVSGYELKSIVGTNGIAVFGQKLAATGITAAVATRNNIEVGSAYFRGPSRPEFMHTYDDVACKVVFDKKTSRILGAQIATYGTGNHNEAIFYFALAIQHRLTLQQLLFGDLYFLPHYNKPFNFIITTLLNALDVKL